MYSDSQGVIALAKNLVHNNASKHIKARYHFVQALHSKKTIERKEYLYGRQCDGCDDQKSFI